MYELIYNWQTLIGSLIGAATPISIWLLSEWYVSYRSQRNYTLTLEKFFVFNLNSVLDTRVLVQRFIDNQITYLIKNIRANTAVGIYSVDIAFFPIIQLHPLEHGLFEQAAQSNYLENKVAHVYKLVKDFGNNIDEARIQFNSSIQLHQTMVFAKANAPDLQNNLYIENLEAFAEMLKRDILENNIRICLKHLIYAKAANDAIRQLGYFRWRFKFSPSFMYFRDRKSLQKYKDESLTRVESYLLPRVKKEVEWIEKQYNFSVVEF